jgi:hypothetical protein
MVSLTAVPVGMDRVARPRPEHHADPLCGGGQMARARLRVARSCAADSHRRSKAVFRAPRTGLMTARSCRPLAGGGRPPGTGSESPFRVVSQVLKEHCRDAQDQRMPIVSQAKTARVPAQFPVVAVNWVRDGPDQRVFPKATGEIWQVALDRDFVCQTVFAASARILPFLSGPFLSGSGLIIQSCASSAHLAQATVSQPLTLAGATDRRSSACHGSASGDAASHMGRIAAVGDRASAWHRRVQTRCRGHADQA